MNRDEQVSKNIDLAGRFFDDLLEHPSELASQPDLEYLILMPEGDNALAAANLKTAGVLIQTCPRGRILLQAVCP